MTCLMLSILDLGEVAILHCGVLHCSPDAIQRFLDPLQQRQQWVLRSPGLQLLQHGAQLGKTLARCIATRLTHLAGRGLAHGQQCLLRSRLVEQAKRSAANLREERRHGAGEHHEEGSHRPRAGSGLTIIVAGNECGCQRRSPLCSTSRCEQKTVFHLPEQKALAHCQLCCQSWSLRHELLVGVARPAGGCLAKALSQVDAVPFHPMTWAPELHTCFARAHLHL